MSAKLTRRQWAAALTPALTPAVLASAIAAQKPAPAPSAAEPAAGQAEELRLAHERMRANAEAVGKVKLPMATEPAFQFKA